MKILYLTDDPVNADRVNTALRSNLKAVARWSTPVTIQSAGAGAAVVVAHDLYAVPNVIDIEPYVDSRVWADQDDRKAWNSGQVVFRSSHAGTFIVRAGAQ